MTFLNNSSKPKIHEKYGMSQNPENTIPDSVYEGKTAVITGGGEGIGLSIAKALGMQRMNIVIADIDKQNLINAQSTLDNMGVNLHI